MSELFTPIYEWASRPKRGYEVKIIEAEMPRLVIKCRSIIRRSWHVHEIPLDLLVDPWEGRRWLGIPEPDPWRIAVTQIIVGLRETVGAARLRRMRREGVMS